jgi:hypothetical protein
MAMWRSDPDSLRAIADPQTFRKVPMPLLDGSAAIVSTARTVSFDGLSISRELPLNNAVELSIRYDEPGEYAFTCQIGMYRGHVVVS